MKTARNTGYKIDYSTNTVTVTKKFMEEAGIIGTPEFNQRKILADMGLTFKIKKTAPRKNNKITYAQMIRYAFGQLAGSRHDEPCILHLL